MHLLDREGYYLLHSVTNPVLSRKGNPGESKKERKETSKASKVP